MMTMVKPSQSMNHSGFLLECRSAEHQAF